MTSKSDVWSFGILLWEIFSFGEIPYQDIEVYQLKRHLMNGSTLEKPPYANDQMYVYNELDQYHLDHRCEHFFQV